MQEVSADDAQRHGITVDDDLTPESSQTKTNPTPTEQPALTSTTNVTSDVPAEVSKDNESERPLFEISLMEPEKHGEGMSAYVTYTIKTRTRSGLLKSPQLQVDRRFNDFHWFHYKLSQQYKGVIIPPLPEKALINRFNPDFIEYRRKELERFLRRVASHPVLQTSELLKAFLELSDSEFAQFKEGPKKEKKGLVASLTDKIGVSVTISGVPVEVDNWYTAQKSYVQVLDNNLQTLLKRSSTISNKHKDMVQLWVDMATAAKSLGGAERDVDNILANSWEKLAETVQQIALLDNELSDLQTLKFDDELKDYIRILDAVRDLLSNRSQALYNFQSASKVTEQKKEKMTNKPKESKLQKEYEEAQKKEEEAKKEYEEINTSCRNELEQFRLTKQREMLTTLTAFAQVYMNHELRVLQLWKELLSFLQDRREQLEDAQTTNQNNDQKNGT